MRKLTLNPDVKEQFDKLDDAFEQKPFLLDGGLHGQFPAFGLTLSWGKPSVWWKPYITIYLWSVHWQIGWLWDAKEDE